MRTLRTVLRAWRNWLRPLGSARPEDNGSERAEENAPPRYDEWRRRRDAITAAYHRLIGFSGSVGGRSWPHCDDLIVHRPGDCSICDDTAEELQTLRIRHNVNFTGESDPSKLPDPATESRDLQTMNRWPGNQRSGTFEILQPADRPVINGLQEHEIVLAKNQSQYTPLRVLRSRTPEGRCMSRWSPTPEQRQAIADGADIFLQQLTFDSLFQPVCLSVGTEPLNPDYFREIFGLPGSEYEKASTTFGRSEAP